jgi:hypothetical protein
MLWTSPVRLPPENWFAPRRVPIEFGLFVSNEKHSFLEISLREAGQRQPRDGGVNVTPVLAVMELA